MRNYFGQMLEIAQSLVGKWALREGRPVHITDDYTRLTLDTIALSGFNYRFDSFAKEELHPFLNALLGALTESLRRSQELPVMTRLRKADDRKYRENIRLMRELVERVIRERRQGEAGSEDDLLGLRLQATDPETGRPLADDNVRDQVLTFLIAGHETTSGLLSFATYSLMRNPHVLAQAYAEVDRLLLGDTVPDYDTIPFDQAAIIPDAVSTPYAAVVATAGVRPAQAVGIWGVGGVGAHNVRLARLVGAAPIIAVDPLPSARERALAFGADFALDPAAPDFADQMRAATAGRGLDFAFDCAGVPAVREQSASVLGLGGSLILVGITPSRSPSPRA
jgi:hypothetical protein